MALGDIVSDVRVNMRVRGWHDTIATAPTGTTGTSMVVGSATMWEIGDVAEFSLDGEQVYVSAVSGTTLTIIRGFNGTTAGTHTNAETVLKNPRFERVQIEERAAWVAERLWPDVYEITTATLTYDSTTVIYNLPTDYEEAVDLVQLTSGSVEDVTRFSNWREMRNVPTGIAAAGKALRITSWPRTDVTATLFYKAKATTATTDTNLQHLIALGTCVQLLYGESAALARDVGTDEIQVQEILRAAQFLEADFAKAKSSYRSLLHPRAGSVRRFIRRPPEYSAG